MRRFRKSLVALSAFLLVFTMVACGAEDKKSDTGPAKVVIGLTEWAVSMDPATAAAGKITFDISNQGGETHEFVIIKTDLVLTELPTTQDGSVDEAGAGIEIAGEVEAVAPGASQALEISLSAGSYVFVCNIVDQGVSHYQNGMRNAFKALGAKSLNSN